MTRILKHIVFVAVIAVALLFSAGASPTVIAAAMAAVAAAAAIGIAAVRHERQKYATLLEAIRNNDFTMRFQKGDKEINALLDSLTEIIKQSKSGAELRERYYKAIIDRVNAGIIAIDSNGNVRICNDNALKMLGMKYAANTAAINRTLPGFDNIIADSTVAGTTIVGCGKDKNLSVSVSGFVHDGNTTTVCVLTDIHNALSHKEVDAWINLTRVLTHEIMNSIAPINALSDSLLPTASGTMKEKIEVIRDTSASLMAFTETFRKFSAIPKPQRQLVYVADLISEATTLLSESIANASVKIHTENDC